MALKQAEVPKPVLTIFASTGSSSSLRFRCGGEDLGRKTPDGALRFIKGFRRGCPYPVDIRFDFPAEEGSDFDQGVEVAQRLFPKEDQQKAPV